MGRDAGRSLGVRAALHQEAPRAVGALRYSTTANGRSGVTSTTDAPRRGSPLRLRANCGLSSDLRTKKIQSKDLLAGVGNVFGEFLNWHIADVYCWVLC
jgi:hypothetical protein